MEIINERITVKLYAIRVSVIVKTFGHVQTSVVLDS